jgi:glycosyltransferase involved in cell wall biosynthesis
MAKASIGLAMMARDAEQTLGKCLDSIRPYVEQIVVGIDVTTTDNTKQVALDHGADVVFPLTVSEEHTCPKHGTVMAQHFAKARQETWSHLDPNLDFYLWLDADDVVKGGEKYADVCTKILQGPAIGCWQNYHYGTVNDGAQTNTLFARERLCRVKTHDGIKIDWQWQHRVHEAIAPKNVRDPHWVIDLAAVPEVYHQEHRHSSHNSSSRNLLLLEIDLEENPNDERTLFYLGNQYFALKQWTEAIYWYERLCRIGKNHYEVWQAWCYASQAYEFLGDLAASAQAAHLAMDVEPKHPEPYQRLASLALIGGEFEKCLYWTEQARHKEPPPFFVFQNPLATTYNERVMRADALAALGRVTEARIENEAAYKVVPNETVGQAIQHYARLERDHATANAFLTLNQGQSDEVVLANYERLGLPDSVKQFGRLRDRVIPAYLRRRSTSQRRIVFWCGRSLEEWSPLSLTTTGIGGSETAVIEIAKRFAADDWRVDVYNGAGRYEGEYDTVGYWEPERLDNGHADVWVTWRHPEVLPRNADKALLWLHDLNYGPGMAEAIREWDRLSNHHVCGVSQWHAEMLERYYDLERVSFVPNGIDLARFLPGVRKEAFDCVYASSPDRGLDRLLNLWPAVLNREPGARLHIAYGWDNIDKLIQRNLRAYVTSQGGRGDLLDFKQHCLNMIKNLGSAVVDHGRISQTELAKLYSESAAWVYPTSFLEVSCISAMEAMAGGAVPVTTRVGALPETVGKAGLLVNGMPESRTFPDFYTNVLLGVLTDVNLRKPLEIMARKRAAELTWDNAYRKWQEVLGVTSPNGVIEAREMVAV